jgi:hypothetical protein
MRTSTLFAVDNRESSLALTPSPRWPRFRGYSRASARPRRPLAPHERSRMKPCCSSCRLYLGQCESASHDAPLRDRDPSVPLLVDVRDPSADLPRSHSQCRGAEAKRRITTNSSSARLSVSTSLPRNHDLKPKCRRRSSRSSRVSRSSRPNSSYPIRCCSRAARNMPNSRRARPERGHPWPGLGRQRPVHRTDHAAVLRPSSRQRTI